MQANACMLGVTFSKRAVFDDDSTVAQTVVIHHRLRDNHILRYLWVCPRSVKDVWTSSRAVQEHKQKLTSQKLQTLVRAVAENGSSAAYSFVTEM